MWIYLDSGNRTGLENMKIDQWLASSWYSETRTPVFRLYGWSPPALSLGFHQPTTDVDTDALKRAGYDLVRRPTGGRAVLHVDEITYSIVLDATRLSVEDMYERISRVLVSGLRHAGYDVTFSQSKVNFKAHYDEYHSVSCFTVSSQHEIQLGGRKLVGSAQRRYARIDGGITALQHGSILTGPAHYKLVEFLTMNDAAKRNMREDMQRSSIDLSQWSEVPFDEIRIKTSVKEAILRELADNRYEEIEHDYILSRMKEISPSMESSP
jgi:lipoyl(octanoyl) transferase